MYISIWRGWVFQFCSAQIWNPSNNQLLAFYRITISGKLDPKIENRGLYKIVYQCISLSFKCPFELPPCCEPQASSRQACCETTTTSTLSKECHSWNLLKFHKHTEYKICTGNILLPQLSTESHSWDSSQKMHWTHSPPQLSTESHSWDSSQKMHWTHSPPQLSTESHSWDSSQNLHWTHSPHNCLQNHTLEIHPKKCTGHIPPTTVYRITLLRFIPKNALDTFPHNGLQNHTLEIHPKKCTGHIPPTTVYRITLLRFIPKLALDTFPPQLSTESHSWDSSQKMHWTHSPHNCLQNHTLEIHPKKCTGHIPPTTVYRIALLSFIPKNALDTFPPQLSTESHSWDSSKKCTGHIPPTTVYRITLSSLEPFQFIYPNPLQS